MAGIFTQTRTWSSKGRTPKGDNYLYLFANPFAPGIREQLVGVDFMNRQVTTSYRSGGAYGDKGSTTQELFYENQRKNTRPFDTGHEFTTEKWFDYISRPKWEARAPGGYFRSGPMPLEFISGADVNYRFRPIDIAKGTFALKETRPTKAAANLALTLSELMVDLPKLPFDAITNMRSSKPISNRAGGEYLNVVFGWQPLISDVIKICLTVQKTAEILGQYAQDSGQQVRRGFDFDEVEEVISTTVINGQPLGGGFNPRLGAGDLYPTESSKYGKQTVTRTRTEKYWFSGAWMYHAESGDDSPFGKVQTYSRYADKLLGVKLDIELLWELAPWSWLADWFANIGDIIAVNNSLAYDNLVLRYGYLMRHSTYKVEAQHTGVEFYTGKTGPVRHYFQYEKKERVRATPYGFGLNTDSFSVNQWAILGALGLTKGEKKLIWG